MQHGVIWTFLVLLSIAGIAEAQTWQPCGPDDSEQRCEARLRKLRIREERRARDEAFYAYGQAHPWRLRLTFTHSLALLGLNDRYARTMWGFGLGFGVQRELGNKALRLEGLGRLGLGTIRGYGPYSAGSPDVLNSLITGGDLHGAFIFRPHPFYIGPSLGLGVLLQEGLTFEGADDHGERILVDLPARAAWLAAGPTLGWERDPSGKFDFGIRALIGAWDTFRRVYLQAGVHISVVLGE